MRRHAVLITATTIQDHRFRVMETVLSRIADTDYTMIFFSKRVAQAESNLVLLLRQGGVQPFDRLMRRTLTGLRAKFAVEAYDARTVERLFLRAPVGTWIWSSIDIM